MTSANARVAFRFAYRTVRQLRRQLRGTKEATPAPVTAGNERGALADTNAISDPAAFKAAIAAAMMGAPRLFSVQACRSVLQEGLDNDRHPAGRLAHFQRAIAANLESARYRHRTGYARAQWRRKLALHPGGINGSSALYYPDYGEFDRPMIAPGRPAVDRYTPRVGPFTSGAK